MESLSDLRFIRAQNQVNVKIEHFFKKAGFLTGLFFVKLVTSWI